jgi:predicted RNA-binding Zn ribbon-like protein
MTLVETLSGVNVYFAHDTELALAQTAALVNTLSDEGDQLETRAGLDAFIERWQFSGEHLGTDEELAQVRALRGRLRAVWTATDRDVVAGMVNAILADADAQPYLSKHDQWDWHLHVTRPDAPLAHRLAAEAAMGFLDLVREDDLDRLKICAAEDCQDVLVDLSRNSSKRYCDTGNCGNRTNVAAYRARKRKQSA